jgi:hypothetical protein
MAMSRDGTCTVIAAIHAQLYFAASRRFTHPHRSRCIAMAPSRPLRLAGAIDRTAAVEAALPDIEAVRAIGDAENLNRLVALAEALATWASQFSSDSPATLLAANVIGVHGIDACMQFIGDNLLRIAPFIDGGTARRPKRVQAKEAGVACKAYSAAEQRLMETLNLFRFLQDHVAGHLRREPDMPYPYDHDPDTVPWIESWQPADDETAAIVYARFRELSKPTEAARRWAAIQSTHDRIAMLGRQSLREFHSEMNSDKWPESFPRMSAVVASARPGKRTAKARAALQKLETCTHRLLDLVPEHEPNGPQPFGSPHQEFFASKPIGKFILAGQRYLNDCLPLLNLGRGSLQAKRKAVLRRIALVAQYSFLASSNGRLYRYLELVDAVGTYAYHLHRDAQAILDMPSIARIDGSREAEVVDTLNRLVIEPKVLMHKRAALGDDAPRLGAMIAAIVADDPLQEKSWERGDKVRVLSKAGVIATSGGAKRSKLDALTTALVRLQQVGLAVQVPFDYLLSKQDALPKRRRRDSTAFAHDGLPWIVNPLGAVLTQYAAVKPKRGRGGRRRATKVKEAMAGRITAKTATKQKSRTSAKPHRTSALSKAAKKWPRA